MAGVAENLTVLAIQWKFCLFVVIKGPEHPGIRVVAIATQLTHFSFMGVVFFMTGEALDRCLWIDRIEMTGFTGGDAMDPDQWKACDVVLKKELFSPAFFIVAVTAILTQIAFMQIDGPMAGDTLGLFQVIHRGISVTGVTTQFFVFAFQFKFSVFAVIELGLSPT